MSILEASKPHCGKVSVLYVKEPVISAIREYKWIAKRRESEK